MKKLFFILILLLALWFSLSPFVLGVSDGLRRGINLGTGLVVVVLAFLGFRSPHAKFPARLIEFISLAMVVWGAIARPLTGAPGGANEIIIGVLWFLLAVVITQLFVFPKISAHDKGGMELTSMSAIRYKNEQIAIKAILLGSMPSTIYLSPEELWKAIGIIDANVIWHLPTLLYRGWKRARQQASTLESIDTSANPPYR